ncbi:SpdA protein [Streptomyces malaysiensis]|uniref:SpdA protein n=1 Tax=Streptomyces malaysiensis TaxID=92644 RepID=UPI003220739F|nr:SpdA protein [Streptomyces malaysiensis]
MIMAAVVGLTFLFGFGNVWTLALRLGVPPWVAPLVAPAVDLSVLGLLLGTRYLALHDAPPEQLRPARRLLVFSSVMTLALNVTDPLLAGQPGKVAFDAVGPLLLIGWAEVGPSLLQAIIGVTDGGASASATSKAQQGFMEDTAAKSKGDIDASDSLVPTQSGEDPEVGRSGEDDLLERAREEDAQHRELYQRPISAETLRKRLRVGAARSRMLVAMVRSSTSHRAVIAVGNNVTEPT